MHIQQKNVINFRPVELVHLFLSTVCFYWDIHGTVLIFVLGFHMSLTKVLTGRSMCFTWYLRRCSGLESIDCLVQTARYCCSISLPWFWGTVDRLLYPDSESMSFSKIINKRPISLIVPPFKISFLATENWPKMKLGQVEVGLNIAKGHSYSL